LVEAADRPAKTYSGGMRRRLDLAVSLIATPPVIFLDEPTTGLDPRSRLVMWEIIKNLMKQGTTILLTTQYLEEADQLADKIILINDGKVAAEGTAEELKSQIGKDQLVLTFTESTLKKAFAKLKQFSPTLHEDDLTIQIKLQHTVKDVQHIFDALDKASLQPITVDIHKPTLDDVFMNITEKTTGDKQHENE
jgi:ABC-2 type transport system ATP-binding protein